MKRIFVLLTVSIFLVANFCFSQEKEQTNKQAVENEITKLAYEIFTYESNGDAESARKYYDWADYDNEPGGNFKKIYRFAFTQEMKTIAQRNWLKAKYNALKKAYGDAGIPHQAENYVITDIQINDALDDVTVIYEHPIAKEGVRFHSKDGKWLIYRDFLVK